jgi:lysophospholipase L1-like esterase
MEVEARRMVFTPVATRAGQHRVLTATVDVRTPESMPSGEEGPGAPGLQVRLTGSNPAFTLIEVMPAPQVPRLVVVSDSTAADWLVGPQRGWAQALPTLVNSGLSIANWADSGESTLTWLSDDRLFTRLQPLLTHRDTVLIQLAHNDKTARAETFLANLRTLLEGVRASGAQPALVTPPVRHLFDEAGRITDTGEVVNDIGVDLPEQTRQLAAVEQVPLLDLTARSQELLERLGEAGSWPLYLTPENDGASDTTHFSATGASAMASLVAGEIRRVGLAVARRLHQGA